MAIYTGDELRRLRSVPLAHPFQYWPIPMSGVSGTDSFTTKAGTTYHFVVAAQSADVDEYSGGFELELKLTIPGLVSPADGLVLAEPATVPLAVSDLGNFAPVKQVDYYAGTSPLPTPSRLRTQRFGGAPARVFIRSRLR